ncbi:MAG: NADP-dependent oxidoreductase [Candidatus Eremiobacteraeota bacterium]|nr:NADP-dependent oxidoreductase [Candidatus Eremiobacteraeota bacterium]
MSTALPETMLAVVLDGAGPPEALDIRTVPLPAVPSDHVLIALDYASVGSWDAKLRSGDWGDVKPGTVPGVDGSGRIAAVGDGVEGFNAGDRVYSYSYGNDRGGFYAEYVSVPANLVAHVPAQIDQAVAGAMPCAGLTAHSGLRALEVEREESLLVFGASGGVGSMAVWLAARAIGASVTGTAKPDAFDYLLKLGAAYAVEPQDSQFKHGFDAALFTTNGDTSNRWGAHLHRGAALAYPNGVEPEPQVPNHEAIAFDGEMSRAALDEFNKAIGTQTIPLNVDVYPFDRVVDAHRRIEAGHVIGKIVLQIR